MTDNIGTSEPTAPETPAETTPEAKPEPRFLVVHPGFTNRDGFALVVWEMSDGTYEPFAPPES
jgi:hypothetical protein